MKSYHKLTGFISSPVVKSAGLYTFSNFFAKAAAFLLLFIYSNPKYISVHENGLLNLLSSSIFIVMPFLSLGIVQSTTVDFFKLKKDEFRDLLTTGFVIPLIATILCCGGLYFFRQELAESYQFPVSFAIIIPLLAFLGFCNEQYVSLIRNNDEPVTYFKASVLRLFIEISISLVLVVQFAWRWEGRVTGIITANALLVLVAYFYFRKRGYLFGKVKMIYLKEELMYAVPIIVMQCSTFCLSSSDKFFLSYFSNNDIVGIYGYACVFATVVTVASSALVSYVMPKIYLCLSAPKVDYGQVRKYFMFYAGCSLVVLIGLFLGTPLLYKYFINSSYYPGLKYMYPVAIGYFFWGICNFFYSFMLYHKHKKKILLLSIASIIISLGCNYFFIKYWSAAGASLAICVSYLVVLVVTLLSCYKEVSSIIVSRISTSQQIR